MNVLQRILKDHFEEMIYIQHPRDSVIENIEKWFIVVILLLVVPCIPILPAEISNTFLSVVIPGYALPAVTCIPLIGLPLYYERFCLSKIHCCCFSQDVV